MATTEQYEMKTRVAEALLKEEGINTLPIDPFRIARDRGIEVRPMPSSNRGVSGMLIRTGNTFGIGYATHIDSEGFKRFSVAHELGHYFLPGHPDHLLPHDGAHESRAGFTSGERYEMEADHFAAGLLMPRDLFRKALDSGQQDGLKAIKYLADLCITSLTATAIQYTKYTPNQSAIIISTGRQIDYCFMSGSLKEIRGLEWIKKNSSLPKSTATFRLNASSDKIASAATDEEVTNLQDWFGGKRNIEVWEEVVGLGSYGKTLTVLSLSEPLDQEALDEEDDLEESWTPRFRK